MNEATPGSVRVLLVDDDSDDYELTREILRELRNGLRCELDWVRTYEDAREALATHAHDVCLLDYYLGPHTGIELLSDSSAIAIGVPIILLTGRGSAGVEKQALAAGAADYLVKGEIDAKTLERSIRHSLERARERRGPLRRRESISAVAARCESRRALAHARDRSRRTRRAGGDGGGLAADPVRRPDRR
jgi:DNA-binding NtrC family response regulator